MSAWLIVPRDPLIFRDGKPFTGTPGERAKSMDFPYPSTIAGAVRTRSGTKPNSAFDTSKINELLGKTVRGPFLVELEHDGRIKTRYFPAPADALIVKDDNNQTRRYALGPLTYAHTDLTKNLVGYLPHVKDKAYDEAPRFWSWEEMKKWLVEAKDDSPDLKTIGLEGLSRDYRMHVSIRKDSQTSEEGALFQTSGMEFMRAEWNAEKRLLDARTLAIALETEADLTEGADSLGGERRIVNWRSAENFLPDCPATSAIKSSGHCRLILATPAHFKNGYLPDYMESEFKVKVEAVALPRYQTISGWDYAAVNADGKRGAPKPTRRLVPAGSVYFLNLENANVEKFIEEVWLKAVSDDEQSRKDGFGIALLGAWDGTVKEMEVK